MGKELFKNIPSKVGDLVKDVRNGRIGLPDLQRPFVWRDNKVRELFDSMLKGYPIGYIMLWESPVDYESKKSAIGDNSKTYEEPKELVIDGQQRLTALVAAMFAVKVKDKNFADREIKISYNPLTREFAVWSQAYEKDTEWISRISDVFLAKEDNSISSLRRHFIKEANEGRSKKEFPLLTDEEEDRIEDNINALLSFAYTLLTRDCTAALESAGLDPYIGFMHRPRPGRRSLALDLMEELRAVYADRFVLSCVNRKIITAKHLQKQESGAVLLTDDGRRAFLGAWQSKKQEQITHPFLKEKIPWGLVPYVQALLLARTLRGDLEAYPPFFWK